MPATAFPAPLRLRSFDRARDAWPLDPAVIHLNHGSFGAVPTTVVAQQDALRRQADLSPVEWFPRIAERVRVARERDRSTSIRLVRASLPATFEIVMWNSWSSRESRNRTGGDSARRLD